MRVGHHCPLEVPVCLAPKEPLLSSLYCSPHTYLPCLAPSPKPSPPTSPRRPPYWCPQWSHPSFCVLRDGCLCLSIPSLFPPQGSRCLVVMAFLCPDAFPHPTPFSHSTAPQRVPVASPSAHNISSSGGAPDRTNFPRGVSSRSTFHAGQLRQVRDQQNLPYGVTPASPSGNSQGRRGASGSIFSKFTSKFVRR